MIPINELRIGNKVKVTISNDAGVYTVLGIPAWGMDGCGDGKEPLVLIDRCPKQLVPESKLKPVLLTGDILGKLGFSQVLNSEIWEMISGRKQFCIGDGTVVFRPDIGTEMCDLSVEVYYFHELQNLYFSLTGTELETQ